jgi:alpha-galactosidase
MIMAKRKIAIIGAGSIIFCKTLILDILATPGMEGTEFALMAPSTRNSSQVERYIQKVIDHNGLNASVYVTTDRVEAVRDARFIIATFQVGGVAAFEMDYRIPLKYGVDSCIGDSMGPGGLFRALRSIPVLLELADEVKRYAEPGALILNYVNPMAMICWTLGTTGVNFVGLCHGVQTTLDLISGYVDVPKDEIDYLCAGINHMAWFLDIKKDGKDLYPLLKERFEQPGYYVNEKVRGEAFRQFGYFMTESTGHLSEYLPWFRSSERALKLYCDEPGFGGESGAYYNWCAHVAGKYEDGLALENEPLSLPTRSVEYGSYIIEAMETGRTFKLNGNVRNDGLISNLPAECCAEVPIYVDALGLHPVKVGALPPQCAALNMTNINVQGLGVAAGLTCDTELIVAAAALDPLTSTQCTLNEVREMCSEMLEAQRKWLPAFKGKTIRKTPSISIPKDVKRADVPVDPALAIMARFGELGK